jgi:hypothetical protein
MSSIFLAFWILEQEGIPCTVGSHPMYCTKTKLSLNTVQYAQAMPDKKAQTGDLGMHGGNTPLLQLSLSLSLSL